MIPKNTLKKNKLANSPKKLKSHGYTAGLYAEYIAPICLRVLFERLWVKSLELPCAIKKKSVSLWPTEFKTDCVMYLQILKNCCVRPGIMALRLSHLWTVKRNPEIYVGQRTTRSCVTTVSAAPLGNFLQSRSHHQCYSCLSA